MYLEFKGPTEPIKKKVRVYISEEKESRSEFKVAKGGQVSLSTKNRVKVDILGFGMDRV